jgi:MFS family permease
MIYPLLPLFLSSVLGANASFIGAIEGFAESTAALLKLFSGWWSDKVGRRKPLVVLGYGLASFVRPFTAIAQTATQVLAIRVTDRVGKGLRSAPRDALLADSVDASQRGRAYGFHAASDNAGAVVGPLAAFALIKWGGFSLRSVFWVAAIPAIIAFVVLVVAVREDKPAAQADSKKIEKAQFGGNLGKKFWAYLVVLLIFTLGNSTDAFLLLRANQLGISVALAPVVWAFLNLVKTSTGVLGGVMSDRFGRKPMIVGGWILYALVYYGFARASSSWHAWALFAAYGIFYGMTEGVEKALVADVVPANRRGAAFGWFNLAIGLGALPASLMFGAIWDRSGAHNAFLFGAGLALLAAVGLTLFVPIGRRSATA